MDCTVKVCDALCGFGKTSAAINMMNNDNERRFIFATQYLTEVERIKNACPARNFKCPEHKLSHGLKKLEDLHALLKAGENIATTHSLFSTFNKTTVELLKANRYVLILDEIIDVSKFSTLPKCDLDILLRSGVIEDTEQDCSLTNWLDKDYDLKAGRFAEEAILSQSNNFIRFDNSRFFWSFHPDIFKAFEETYVLTYLFSGQILKCYFDMYGIKYKYIGVKQAQGTYEYCSAEEMDRKLDLRNKIHILDHKKLNSIGDNKYKLSLQWYKKSKKEKNGNLDQVKANISNYFKNIVKAKAEETMWTVYKDYKSQVQGKGYTKSFVTYNKRATNDYADRKYLAYCVNLFPRPWEIEFFSRYGVEILGDMYALGYLIQWIFRSAIRTGKEIWIYIPSRRMRCLLEQWMTNLAEGHDLDIIEYKNKRQAERLDRTFGHPSYFKKKGA